MFVFIYANKRTYTRTLCICCPLRPAKPDVEAAITRPGGSGLFHDVIMITVKTHPSPRASKPGGGGAK
jgi:hypothetical protein